MGYIYNYSNDNFLNNKIDIQSLSYQIGLSTLSGLQYINTYDNHCEISFENELLPSEETTLSGIVSFHDGVKWSVGVERTHIELIVLSNRSVMSTTSEDWKTIAKKQDCFFSGGSYKVSWSYFWKALTDDANPFIEVRAFFIPVVCVLNEYAINIDFINEAKGIFYKKILSNGNSSQAISESGFTYLPLDAGEYQVYLQYRRSGSFGTVAVCNSNLEIFKASEEPIGSNLISLI